MKKETDFSIFAKYVSFNVVSMIGLSCYILVDTYFIANGLGADGLAALNLAIPVYSLINGIGLMHGIGGGTRYAIAKATGQKKECDRIFTNMIEMAFLLGVVFVMLGIFQAKNIARILGADADTLFMTASYIRITLIFAPAFLWNGIVNCFVKNDGNPRLAMCAMLAGSFLNIVLDYVFIFPMNLGMSGAALATGSAPVAGLLVLSLHFLTGKNEFHLQNTGVKKKIILDCLPLGIPSLVTEISSGAVIVIFNILILGLAGNVGIAAYGIIANISLVVIAVYTGIAQGMQPVVSEAYGRQMKDRMKHMVKYGLVTTAVLSVVAYFSLCGFAPQVSEIFNKEGDKELMKIAVKGIRIYFSGILGAGTNIVLASYFASVERKMPAQIISVLRGFLLIIPFAFLLSKVAGLTGIWLAFPAAEYVTALVGMMILVKKRIGKVREENPRKP